MSGKILRLPKVMEKTGKCRSTVYADMGNGNFPKSIPIGARAVGWLEEEVEQWISERVEMRRATSPAGAA
jgi:prophage regulatory protein